MVLNNFDEDQDYDGLKDVSPLIDEDNVSDKISRLPNSSVGEVEEEGAADVSLGLRRRRCHNAFNSSGHRGASTPSTFAERKSLQGSELRQETNNETTTATIAAKIRRERLIAATALDKDEQMLIVYYDVWARLL